MARKILLIASLALIISFSSAYADSISVEINDKSHEIEYTPFKLAVTGVEADIDFGSLIFSVNVVEDNASLKIVFDRILLDSKYQGQDGDFFVLADGEEVEFDEKKTTTQRTLTFAVEMGTEEIEVIGSHIAGIAIFESTVSTPITEDVEKEAAEKAAAEKAAAEKAAAEKAAAEKAVESEQKLKDACGVGTVYQDGECVLSPQLKQTDATKSMSFILPIVVGFGIAMGVLLVLWGIGKRSNKELED